MYDLDKFVNTNKANIQIAEDRFDEDQAKSTFEDFVKFDNINEQAFPVLVYEMNTKAVAWYDLEMFMGYTQ